MNTPRPPPEVERILNIKGKTKEQLEESSASLLGSLAELTDDQQLRSRLAKELRIRGNDASEIQNIYSFWLKEFLEVRASMNVHEDCKFSPQSAR